MGQTIVKAVQRNGIRTTAPSWTGWIYKAGVFNKRWKKRYFCLEEERLYYFKDPNKGSKGFIPLKDASGMCLLKHRPEIEDTHRGHIPFVLCTSERIWMLAFENDTIKTSFIEAMLEGTGVQLAKVIAEEWAMVRMDSQCDRWQRVFMVYISNGELLYFANGGTTKLSGRVTSHNIIRVDCTHQSDDNEFHRDLNLIVILDKFSMTLSFDSLAQYERWKLLLLNVLTGDVRGENFSRFEKKLEAKRKSERQSKAKRLRQFQKNRQSDLSYSTQASSHRPASDDLNQQEIEKMPSFSEPSVAKKSVNRRFPRLRTRRKLAHRKIMRREVCSPSEGIAMTEFKINPPLPTEPYPEDATTLTLDSSLADSVSVHVQVEYDTLKEKMKKSTSLDMLHQQVTACARAISTLSQLYADPLSPRSQGYIDPGDWYTEEPPGGKFVRHWIHRSMRVT